MTYRKVNHKSTAILALLVVAVLCIAFACTGRQAFAYEVSGQYSINSSMTDVDEMPAGLAATTFHLYKVGHFEGEDPVFVLDEAYADIPVSIPLDYEKDDFESEDAWTRAWLDSANTMSNYVKEETLVSTFQSAPDGSFTVSGVENGLYLLKGDSQKITDYPTAGQDSYWWPQPMYVKVLNGNVDIGVKPQTELITKLQIVKTWQGDEKVKDTVRPASVTAEIYYDNELRETVALGPSEDPKTNWTYEWETAQGENDPSKWTCREVLTESDAENYSVTISERYTGGTADAAKAGCTKHITLTNTYIGKNGGGDTDNPPSSKAKTGDSFRLGVTLTVMALALIAGLILLLKRRRDR